MKAADVTGTLQDALRVSGCNGAHKPRLLSDNGSSYIAGELAEWLQAQGMDHVRGAPNHPQTQGKIERWHQTLKNRVLLENYYLPGDLENQIGAFIEHYNNRRYHESLGNSDARRRLSGGPHPSSSEGRGSRNGHSNCDGWRIGARPLNIKPDEPKPPLAQMLS